MSLYFVTDFTHAQRLDNTFCDLDIKAPSTRKLGCLNPEQSLDPVLFKKILPQLLILPQFKGNLHHNVVVQFPPFCLGLTWVKAIICCLEEVFYPR